MRHYIALRFPAVVAAALVLFAAPVAAQETTKPLTPSQQVAPDILVARINANCGVVADAIKSQKPAAVAVRATSDWKVVSEADGAAAERQSATRSVARLWTQAGNYVWLHEVSHDANGNQHATQLCFRNDGTLARVRTGSTFAESDLAGGKQTYYNTDGSVIGTVAIATDDPLIVQRIQQLPFFSMLPPIKK